MLDLQMSEIAYQAKEHHRYIEMHFKSIIDINYTPKGIAGGQLRNVWQQERYRDGKSYGRWS